jgi:hypothetical protein
LQAIFEHLARQQPLPPKLPTSWIRSHFTTIDDSLFRRIDQTQSIRNSPYHLLYGTEIDAITPTTAAAEYTREPTDAEEAAFVEALVQNGHASAERHYVASLKASRDAIRARLQENKALHRVYMVGDWVLRVRRRKSKNEPYYDGPWLIRSVHAGNTYSIGSPGGIQLDSKINGIYLYPAYVTDGHPERSLWYANKTLLENDRRRQLGAVGLEPAMAKQRKQFTRSRFIVRDPD